MNTIKLIQPTEQGFILYPASSDAIEFFRRNSEKFSLKEDKASLAGKDFVVFKWNAKTSDIRRYSKLEFHWTKNEVKLYAFTEGRGYGDEVTLPLEVKFPVHKKKEEE